MTYFAFDGPLPGVGKQIVDEIAALKLSHRGGSVNVFALVDGAFDELFFTSAFRVPSPRISLYACNVLRDFGAAAPFLVQAPDPVEKLTSWIDYLVSACGVRPMWSLVVSSMSLDELANHFSPYLIAHCDDNLDWPVRWGDTRVLPELLGNLPPAITDDLLLPLYFWLALSREGKLLKWEGRGAGARSNVLSDRMPLSDHTFARIVDASEADAILAQIGDTDTRLLSSKLPSECYRLVKHQLAIADRFDIVQPRHRSHFGAMALYMFERFVERPEFQDLLANIKAGKEYFSEIEKLPDEFWNAGHP